MNRPKEPRSANQLQFVTSAVQLQGCPEDSVPEVAIVGRSNAGKSSLINGLARARVAMVSGTPGKTRLLNFYQGPHYRLVDMPGYGFAARSNSEQKSWKDMVETFLAVRGNLTGLLVVMDIRRDWTRDEENFLRWISPRGLSAAIVLTKADKISRSAALQAKSKIQKTSGAAHIFATSALKKQGFAELEDFIFKSWIKSAQRGFGQEDPS